MALITTQGLELEAAKRERAAVLITVGDTNGNGLADVTVEVVTDPPGKVGDVHFGPFTKDVPVDQALAVVDLGARALRVPGVPLEAFHQVVAMLRAASRLP